MQESLEKETIKRKIQELPLVDVAVFEVITMLDDPDTNFERISENLSPDVASRFLEMANSAYYGRQVRSIGYAVRVLGFNQMKKILTSAILMSHLIKKIDFEKFNFDKFQKQAQFCGVVSRVLGEILGYERPADLYTVAILQNMGKLVLATHFRQEFEEINTLKTTEHLSSLEAEHRVLGIGHAEIGALVLEKFKIPADICNAVRYHDAHERTIPDGDDFQLEFIARKATRIVSKFTLPEDVSPDEISDRLRGTVAEGRKRYREQIEDGMQEKGFRDTFVDLLTMAGELVCRDLRVFVSERNQGEAGLQMPANEP